MTDKRIMYIMKNWGAQGILSYQIKLVSLLSQIYESITFVQNPNCVNAPCKQISLSKTRIFLDIIKERPDVIIIFHFFGSSFITSLLLLSKMLSIKTIIVTDFTETGLPRIHKSPLKTLKDCLRYILFSSQLFLVDTPVCFTEYEKNVLSKILSPRNKFRIIPIGNDFEIGTSNNKERFTLTVSRWWSDRKNLHTILKVLSNILRKMNYKLVIVGKFHEGTYYIPDENRWETGEEYKQKIIKLIKRLDLEDYVEFVGVKLGKDLQELYRKAKIFYLPSKNETFGMVYVEAMASGTPIVAMKNSAVQYVVKDGVTGFLRNNEEGQKEAILKLLTDEKLYKEMQKNCLKKAEKYRWENVIRRWERLIKELMGLEKDKYMRTTG